MFNQGTEEYIVFIEDDSFIYKKGVLDEHFKILEGGAYGVIGAPRWSCTGELIDRAKDYFNLHDFKYEVGGWFWPCFCFAKRSDLDKTDLNFCGKHWEAGEYLAPLQWTTPTPLDSDTFVWMSMQLRGLGLMCLEIDTPNDVTNPAFGWVHTTSLSSPMEYLFTDDDDCPVSLRKHKSYHKVEPTYAADTVELEKKMAWMKICLEKFDYSEIKEFRDIYEKAINKAITKFNCNETQINNFINAYKGALGL